MRKLICICCLLMMTTNIQANDQETVSLSRCIDGDTAAFLVNGKEEKVRFLAINAPEYTKKKERYGKESSAYVCDKLEAAEAISLEYEPSNKRDKYDRLLAWVFVDGELLQEELVEEGLAEVKYIYGDYAYTDMLYEKEAVAKKQKLNMWSDEEDDPWYYITIAGIIVLMILVVLFKQKGKKRSLNRLSKELKKRI
ncbi:micrococcal nuclease [Breznakia sp. PF5-3]|uniref:thermonuclease family protein n=1 Tax=unclassified Breznakia TaxID=2623764 RepID=UPI002406A90F|nr:MULTISPECIES: thermonuclease family protein [unclassified Breznakia]MDF9824152.1 micrococcal nuclease [Breznakia sp. PM6-1]MDF9834950.1 micrococcal nuclease [Breznakia sp. PF5-3]MDF9837181.1 micrococcal nuclease [Breznakia sp. PFB2-8]MDF9859171.1 micrococcal nuclease [Breznakia sp. PH5-24]